MNADHDPFRRANTSFRRLTYHALHQQQSKQLILRSQLGFNDPDPSRPRSCRGCANYHGVSYCRPDGMRSVLICGFHPYGWQETGTCPDWQASQEPISSGDL